MSAAVDVSNPDKPKRVAIVASNPSVSKQTGWPIGFWWAELTHPYYEFVAHGYKVDICSPDGGKLQADSWSDPRDKGRLMADDLISLGFIYSPQHRRSSRTQSRSASSTWPTTTRSSLSAAKDRCTRSTITTTYTSWPQNFTSQARLLPSFVTPHAFC